MLKTNVRSKPSQREEEKEIERLKASIRSHQARQRALSHSLQDAWSMPMSQVNRLKESVEEEGRSIRKKITAAEDEIRRLQRVMEDSA